MPSKHKVIQAIISSLFLLPLSTEFSYASQSENPLIGSGLTDEEEALAISGDPSTSELIQKASKEYGDLLNEYKKGSLSWDQLQTSHDKIFTNLICDIKTQIENSKAAIHAIANDYDSEHASDLNQHIQLLLGLAQQNLEISAANVLLPSLPNTDLKHPNLIKGADFPSSASWKLASGSGSLINGQIITNNPNGASFSQTVETTPNHWYLISGNINGADQGKDRYGNENVYSGTITAINANKNFPQSSDELDEGNVHRRYFWVQASDTSIDIYLSGTGAIGTDAGPSFQNISVRDLNIDCSTATGQDQAMALAQIICPPVRVTGSQEVGWYPQIEKQLTIGDNLIDGTISIMKNIDMSALGNAGHPYWYFGKENENPMDKNIKIINGLNGSHGLTLPAGSNPTTNGPVPIPLSDYTISCDVYVPEDFEGSIRVLFSGTNLNDGSQIEKSYQDFNDLSPGKNVITLLIPASTFPSNGLFFRPTITFENNSQSSITIYNMALIPNSDVVYTLINNINPYNPDRSWYNPNGCVLNYDFTKAPISSDWGIALTGNTMFSANTKDVNLTDEGVILTSHSQNINFYDGGGIQSTQLIDPMRNFSISVTFMALGNDLNYEPTFAVWTYGESQRGPDAPLSHRNGSGSDLITEFDCEMGSDANKNHPPSDSNTMYMRPGSYIGYEAGGHNAIPLPEAWPLIPNFWQKNPLGIYDPYNLTLSGSWVNGHLILQRTIENIHTKVLTTIGTQDLGQGPFSLMYIKIAMENPTWNAKSHTIGQASLAIQKITITQGVDIPENINHKIPLSEMDYMWFTPGGGGGLSYTSLLP